MRHKLIGMGGPPDDGNNRPKAPATKKRGTSPKLNFAPIFGEPKPAGGGLTEAQARGLRQLHLLKAVLHDCAPNANPTAIEYSAHQILAANEYAGSLTAAAEGARQMARLSSAADEFQAALWAVAPDVVATFDEELKRKLRKIELPLSVAIRSGATGGGFPRGPAARSSKTRAAIIADMVAEAYSNLTGREPTMTRPADGSPGHGPALALMKAVFQVLGEAASAESQLRAAADRRKA
jgi:hypothetical protein